ncbi:unnamed protein product [Rhodiola kirilowii]
MLRLFPAPCVTTMAVCPIFLQFLALAMVIDFALGAPDEMLEEDDEEEADSPRDPFCVTKRGTPRNRTICRIIIRIFVMSVTLPILLWTVYMGYKLVNKPRESEAENVDLIVGIITMAFGITLLLNGIIIAKELSQELSTLTHPADFGADKHFRQQLAGFKA